MDHILAFPKIAALGTRHVQNIFEDEVEITEKIDGSQFVFGWDANGEYFCRSKGKQMYADGGYEKMFAQAVEYTHALDPYPDWAFYCEYLQRPKHNTLTYDRTPVNHLMLFGAANFARTAFVSDRSLIESFARVLGIEPIPLIYQGTANPGGVLNIFEDGGPESALGGVKPEGVVIKNYHREMNYGEQVYPIMTAKYVTEKFKEKHKGNHEYAPRKDRWELFKEQYRTEARWEKAVQFLRETGELAGEPRDIGKLIKRVQVDVNEECKQEIMDFLWKFMGAEVARKATAGLPEWYKEKLALGEINTGE